MLKYITILSITFSLTACNQVREPHEKLQNPDSTKADPIHTFKRPPGAILWIRHENFNDIQLPPEVAKLIGNKYLPLDTAMGDFNLDNINDLLLVTYFTREERLRYSSKPTKRELLLFAGQRDSTYKLVTRTRNAVPCIGCCGMGDPFGGIRLSNGELTIIQYCASNCKSLDQYTFRFDKASNQLLLNNKINESFCFNYQDYSRSTTSYTGRKKTSLSAFDIFKEDE
jgi:hypothetical protein